MGRRIPPVVDCLKTVLSRCFHMGAVRPCVFSTPESKRRKLIGSDHNDGCMYECSRFTWRNRREFMETTADNKFATKRMALLYVAKMNSNSVQTFAASSGRQWDDLCKDSGKYAITPNAPFDERFLDLPDEILEKYAEDVGTILHVFKAPEGSTYRYKAASLNTISADDLAKLLGV